MLRRPVRRPVRHRPCEGGSRKAKADPSLQYSITPLPQGLSQINPQKQTSLHAPKPQPNGNLCQIGGHCQTAARSPKSSPKRRHRFLSISAVSCRSFLVHVCRPGILSRAPCPIGIKLQLDSAPVFGRFAHIMQTQFNQRTT